ncbi:MAG: molybdopterin-guanine dinucleotide biosynthesis protein B [Thermodesulfobacteriota bacterium]|nr:molybdopterin-guanine dinucleotide biosynthesis protein B [Thermodesulfobacteriota bacterium]
MKDTIISFVARGSDSGKTRVMERVISKLRARGLKVTAVKHSGRLSIPDKEGKDSYRFAMHGAQRVIAFSDEMLFMYEMKTPDLDYFSNLASQGVDVVLIEGFKHGPYKKIEVFNPGVHDLPMCIENPGTDYIALVARQYVDAGITFFDFDDIDGICRLIESLL